MINREKYFSDEQILNHYREMNSCMPILVHVMPFLSGYDVKNMNWPVKIFKGLSSLENIIAVKEDTKDIDYRFLCYKIINQGLDLYLQEEKDIFKII